MNVVCTNTAEYQSFAYLQLILSESPLGWDQSYVDVTDVELFGCVTPLEVASGVDVVVTDNSGDYVRR